MQPAERAAERQTEERAVPLPSPYAGAAVCPSQPLGAARDAAESSRPAWKKDLSLVSCLSEKTRRAAPRKRVCRSGSAATGQTATPPGVLAAAATRNAHDSGGG